MLPISLGPGSENRFRYFCPWLFLVWAAGYDGRPDILFTLDNSPAISAIISAPSIVLSVNICAIVGLRARYFLWADTASRCPLLACGLALWSLCVGAKVLLVGFPNMLIGVALMLTAGLIAASVLRHRVRRRVNRPA